MSASLPKRSRGSSGSTATSSMRCGQDCRIADGAQDQAWDKLRGLLSDAVNEVEESVRAVAAYPDGLPLAGSPEVSASDAQAPAAVSAAVTTTRLGRPGGTVVHSRYPCGIRCLINHVRPVLTHADLRAPTASGFSHQKGVRCG